MIFFQECVCFSVIFSHRKFLHKSVDFAADTKEVGNFVPFDISFQKDWYRIIVYLLFFILFSTAQVLFAQVMK